MLWKLEPDAESKYFTVLEGPQPTLITDSSLSNVWQGRGAVPGMVLSSNIPQALKAHFRAWTRGS